MNSEETYSDLSEEVLSIEKSLSDVGELVHSWRFLTGVVYALNQYHLVANQCPPGKTENEEAYIQETHKILSRVLGRPYPYDRWLRGFYYNAALMRLDACYERLFRAYLRDKLGERKCPKCKKPEIDGQELYKQIRNEFSSLFTKNFDDSSFGKVRREVNSLKHLVGGADPAQREKPKLLYSALKELIDFIRNPDVVKKLKENFSGRRVIAGRKMKP